jgi:nanoRNase/pAp phosphatase (c-di-AMP/oligoRNAs hydrolase)
VGQKVSAEDVEFAYTGAEYDLVVVFDTPELPVLGSLYEEEKDIWSGVPIVNIDRNPANTQYGQLNILDTEASSTSATVFRLIKSAGLPLSKEGAETLLAGLREASAGFTKSDPQIFETAAEISRVARGNERVETSEEKLVNEPFRKKEDYIELGAKLLG